MKSIKSNNLSFSIPGMLSIIGSLMSALSVSAWADSTSYSEALADWEAKVAHYQNLVDQDCKDIEKLEKDVEQLKAYRDESERLWEKAEQDAEKLKADLAKLIKDYDRVSAVLSTHLAEGRITQAQYDVHKQNVSTVYDAMEANIYEQFGVVKRSLREKMFYYDAGRYNTTKRRLGFIREIKEETKADLKKLRENPPLNPTLAEQEPQNETPSDPEEIDKVLDRLYEDFKLNLLPSSPNYVDADEIQRGIDDLEKRNAELSALLGDKDSCLTAMHSWDDYTIHPAQCNRFVDVEYIEVEQARNSENGHAATKSAVGEERGLASGSIESLASGAYSCSGGWGRLNLSAMGQNRFTGDYSGTYDKSAKGMISITFGSEGNAGEWEEVNINRKGFIKEIKVLADGFSAKWGVISGMGGHFNGRPLPESSGSVSCRKK